MNNPNFSFTPVKFDSIKKVCTAPVGAAVHKSSNRHVSFRFSTEVMTKTKFAAGTRLAPFLDIQNRAILFLSDVRPLPDSARKMRPPSKGNRGTIDFPRADGFDKLFPCPKSMTGLQVVEISQGRLVVSVPKWEV